MDRLDVYRAEIKRLLREHQTIAPPEERIERVMICDEARDHYLLLELGWDKHRRLDGVVIYVRIRDSKIWVEVDWTEYGIARELADAGVPKDDIVLAFHTPEKRRYTEFAAA